MDKKLFKIKTIGCKVNQYEGQAIREQFLSLGYEEATENARADVYVVNTCTVTEKADKDSRHALRHFRKENLNAEIIATGCYAEASPEAIRTIDENIKIVKNSEKHTIHGINRFEDRTRAFIKVQDGCNNFCSYCIVPYVRGRSKSRPPEDIIKESESLIRNGYKELVLCGICLGDFGKDLDGINLTWLIKKISEIEGDFRIRLSSIELQDVTGDLIDEMTQSKKLCHHLHIPLQSGDDDILKKMNRSYASSDFIKKIRQIRSKIKDMAITTDVIVGFPTESDTNFKNTLKAIKAIRPSRTHIFTYSPRSKTKAFEIPDKVSIDVKAKRLKTIRELSNKLAKQFISESCNKRERVLIEAKRDKKTSLLVGYTDRYIRAFIDGPNELKGKLIFIQIRNCI